MCLCAPIFPCATKLRAPPAPVRGDRATRALCGAWEARMGRGLPPHDVHDKPEAHQRGDVGDVVRRAHLHELHTAEPLGLHPPPPPPPPRRRRGLSAPPPARAAAVGRTATMLTILRASRGMRPPGSGQPVPGTTPASIESMS
jgi:hypothetical protein